MEKAAYYALALPERRFPRLAFRMYSNEYKIFAIILIFMEAEWI
jgi:hypothetical protein